MTADKPARSDDMRVRTRAFAGTVIELFVSLGRRREELRVIGKQMLRSGTSVGANYREASRARSVAEFIAKIEQCAQEADETHYWIELLRDDRGIEEPALQSIWGEADELIRIFVTMSKNTKEKNRR